MNMHPLLKLLLAIPLVLYYIVEGFVLFFIPRRLRYKDITGETVLITGAGSGIGRELSLQFANRGARLVLLDIDKEWLQETQEIVAKKFPNTVDVFVYECDLSNRHAVYTAAAKIKEEVGFVNILVNNAGVVTGKSFLDCPDDMIQKTIDVNLMAHFWTCKAFLPDMKAANRGHIVSVASLAGFLPSVKLTDYCASKYAAVGFDESLRLELEHEDYTGIKTTLVAPYLVKTGLFQGFEFPMFAGMTPEWVAQQIISGVLVNQEIVSIPSYFVLVVYLHSFLPRKVVRLLYKSVNFTDCMKNFQGRKKTE